MRLQGERVYELPPLTDTESVSLFCERSQTEPTDAARGLCVRLEGLPLAIELAAARTSVLTPEQITDRLSQRLDLLKGVTIATPARRRCGRPSSGLRPAHV